MKTEHTIGQWKIETMLSDDMPPDTKYVVETHGPVIVDEKDIRNGITEADGIVTYPHAHPVAIQTADCLPMVITSEEKALAIHVSRKTLIAGILDNITDQIAITNITGIYLGPHICEKDFTFDYEGEAITQFKQKFPEAYRLNEKIHLSVRKAVQQYLDKWGIGKEKVTEDTSCTYEEKELPSYRHALSQGTTNKNIATIVST